MLKIENIETYGWEAAIRGCRNPLNSWAKSDSRYDEHGNYIIGENDLALMLRLAKAGSDHAKYRRMITVTMDITAPLYWWKEHDQYKVGTVTNSCSTMHRIHERDLTIEDFSAEHLDGICLNNLENTINLLNLHRKHFIDTKDKHHWWQMIQLLPSSFNQKRTVQLNYEVLANMYHSRRNHKLDEWHTLCDAIERLPYSEIITGVKEGI